jgi:hypothetical protein
LGEDVASGEIVVKDYVLALEWVAEFHSASESMLGTALVLASHQV